MNEATIALTVMTSLIFVIFLGFLIWGVRSGQFKNVEEAKFIPLQEDRPADVGKDKDVPSVAAGDHGKDKGEGR